MSKTKRLRELLNSEETIVAPGAYDALTAKAIEYVGFPLVSTTGYGMHGAMLGSPDNGLLAFNEMVASCGNIVEAVQIPVMADAESGYGNAINTIRTVREFEKAGLAGIFIEDQKLPPTCPFIGAPTVIEIDEMVGKIKAAVDARRDPNFVIVARTDAPFEEAVEIAKAYTEAGADMIKIVPKTKKELELLPQRVMAPLHLGYIPGKDINAGMTCWDLGDLGYKIITFPISLLFMSTKAVIKVLREIKEKGCDEGLLAEMTDFEEYAKIVDGDKFKVWEAKYLPGK